jgi:hypothetical protein
MRFIEKPTTKALLARHMARSHHTDLTFIEDITLPHLKDIHEDAIHGDSPDDQTHTHWKVRR